MKRKSKVSIEEWINRCNKVHNNKYDYSKSIFNHLTDNVTIICDIHGEFIKRADLHLRSGCSRCAKNKKFHIDDIKNLLSNSKYFFILPFDNYYGNRQKIEVICKENNHKSTKSIHHILSNNVDCSHCTKTYKLTKEEWILLSNKVHNNKYDYSISHYESSKSKVDIICPEHGIFKQIAFSHKSGSGCKKCNKSIGENIICDILKRKNITFIEQKTFNGLRYKSNLYFDFYLPEYNMCIEFDGMQHSKSYYFFGGDRALKERINRDNIKNDYCKNNNIDLLRISYQINYKTRDKVYIKIEEKISKVLNGF